MPLLGLITSHFTAAQKLFRPKSPDVNVVLTFQGGYCLVKLDIPSSLYDSDSWLIATFLTYLAFYLYAGHTSQAIKMRGIYKGIFESEETDYEYYMPWLCDYIINETFSKLEKKAAKGLFDQFHLPPFSVYEDDGSSDDNDIMGRYTYQLSEGADGLVPHLELSRGLDLFLFPLSVVHMYKFTYDRLSSKEYQTKMREISLKLLESLEHTKPTVRWHIDTPDEILRNAGLLPQR